MSKGPGSPSGRAGPSVQRGRLLSHSSTPPAADGTPPGLKPLSLFWSKLMLIQRPKSLELRKLLYRRRAILSSLFPARIIGVRVLVSSIQTMLIVLSPPLSQPLLRLSSERTCSHPSLAALVHVLLLPSGRWLAILCYACGPMGLPSSAE
jgi:hypothetical protein